jgi:peptidoglycan/LPS O-acetylase OafA/YrhL
VRIASLDYLRGLAALGIMIYHLSTWTWGSYDSGSFLGRLGIYGVALFYVLSGLTLFHVYHQRLQWSRLGLKTFFLKRIYRIYPLLWLTTALAILQSGGFPNLFDLLLNLTGLFGFVKWYTYFSAGVWSIGNELVFYSLFPIFIYSARRSGWTLGAVVTVLLGLYLYFAWFGLDSNEGLAQQWRMYINPLNQAFLFVGGFVVGHLSQHWNAPRWLLGILFGLGLGIFLFYPVEGDAIALVTGAARMAFTASCLLLCLSLYKWQGELTGIPHRILATLGELSYSVYLLHPLVWREVIEAFRKADPDLGFSPWTPWLVSAALTLGLSAVVYHYFERRFMERGNRRIAALRQSVPSQ